MKKWSVLAILGCAQFVMVLDGTVMNVSISAVVEDRDSTVAAMQTAITFYTLTMASVMLLGAPDPSQRGYCDPDERQRRPASPLRLVPGLPLTLVGG